jgi:hypothetical protein
MMHANIKNEEMFAENVCDEGDGRDMYVSKSATKYGTFCSKKRVQRY